MIFTVIEQYYILVIMIIENELSANHIYSKNSLTSIVLRVIIMMTTAALLATVIKFHVHEVQVCFVIDNF